MNVQDFLNRKNEYYGLLKENFEKRLESAEDKAYLTAFFRQTFLDRNTEMPYNTVYFSELYALFKHFQKVGEVNYIQSTLQCLPQIKEKSELGLEKLMEHRISPEVRSSDFPIYYRRQLENYTLSDLISLEMMAVDSTEEYVCELLASYEATKQLISEIEETQKLEEPKSQTRNHTHQFTHSQQVLFAYYLFKLAKLEPRVNADITAFAEFLHGLTGIPYTNIKNSELYKKFLNPLDHSSSKRTIEDLKLVRSHFLKLGATEIITLIDKDIKGKEQE
jgi:hypothetical protein